MNIKQLLSTIYKILANKIGHFILGYWPTSDDIENDKVKSLGSRLKAESYKETLTNILEWQERNMEFWTERQPILPLLGFTYLIFGAAAAILSAGFLISILLVIVLNSQLLLIWLVQIAVWFIQNPWLFIAILASITITILATIISILHSNRKFPWKEVPRGLKNVFWPSISMKWLLENKLGVCRDYAKLTACLLSNIYPNAEIYFATAPGHVATGINIDRLYMLDQRLPILTIDRWNDYRKPRKSDTLERFDPARDTLQKVDTATFLQTKNKSELNIEARVLLAKRMTELLNIKEQPDDKTISLEIPCKRGAILYEENEMVDYSLARHLKTKISSELIRVNQITGIEISRNKDDLTFLIRFRQNK